MTNKLHQNFERYYSFYDDSVCVISKTVLHVNYDIISNNCITLTLHDYIRLLVTYV